MPSDTTSTCHRCLLMVVLATVACSPLAAAEVLVDGDLAAGGVGYGLWQKHRNGDRALDHHRTFAPERGRLVLRFTPADDLAVAVLLIDTTAAETGRRYRFACEVAASRPGAVELQLPAQEEALREQEHQVGTDGDRIESPAFTYAPEDKEQIKLVFAGGAVRDRTWTFTRFALEPLDGAGGQEVAAGPIAVQESIPDAPVVLRPGRDRPVDRLVMGVNANAAELARADPAVFWAAVRVLQPTILRYPGGTVGALWDLNADRYYPPAVWDQRLGKTPLWRQWNVANHDLIAELEDRSRVDHAVFARGAAELDAEVSWVLNLATDPEDETPHAAVRFMRSLQEEGIAVRHVELGNELASASFDQRFPRVEDYLAEIDPLVTAIRELHPGVALAYPSGVPFGATEGDAENVGGSDRHEHWLRVTREREDGIHLVPHSYLGAGDLPPRELVAWRTRATPAARRAYLLASPGPMVANAEAWIAGSDKRLWQTEYNLWLIEDEAGAYRDTMVSALYLAHWQLRMLASEIYTVAHVHSLGGSAFRLLSYGDDALTLSPQAELFSRLATTVRRARRVRLVEADEWPTIAPGFSWGDTTTPGLVALLFELDDGGRRLVALNLCSQPIAVDLAAFGTPSAIHTVHHDQVDRAHTLERPIAELAAPLALPLAPQPVAPGERIAVPAYSFTEVDWAAGG